MSDPCILFRKSIDTERELEVAKKHFTVHENRAACCGQVVIGRYSVLPYYEELYKDLDYKKSVLINSHAQHTWIANFDWYASMSDLTPTTWFSPAEALASHQGPWVIKGRTNSRKHDWNRSMYATDKKDFWSVFSELSRDEFIGRQELVFRQYVPLKVLETGLNGLPFSNEWRFFFLGRKLLSYGYYWSSATEETIAKAKMTIEGLAFAERCANIATSHTNFFVLDIAEKEKGGWTLIEINDGQCSGLSENDPDVLYRNLKEAL